MKLATKVVKPAAKTPTDVTEQVTTVPPTREVPTRVVAAYSPKKYTMFWNDKPNRVYHELHATLRGAKLTVIEGICGEPLQQTVRTYRSAAEAAEAFDALENEKYALWWQRIGKSARTDFFFVGPSKKKAPAEKAKSKRRA